MKTISENDENRLHHGIAKKEGLMKCFQISRWLASDMAGTLAGSDREALDKWLAESEANRETYREFKQDFLCGKGMGPYSDEEVEHQLSLFYRHRTRSRRIPFYYYAVASVVLWLLVFQSCYTGECAGITRCQILLPLPYRWHKVRSCWNFLPESVWDWWIQYILR